MCIGFQERRTWVRDCNLARDGRLQGYLAHKKQPHPPQGHHMTLGIVLLQGPRRSLLSEEANLGERPRLGFEARVQEGTEHAPAEEPAQRYLSIYLSIYLSVYIYIYIYIYIYMYIYICICINIYIYTYIHIYI